MRERQHRLVRLQGERARLVTPEGGGVELTRETWLRLAEVVGQMFGVRAPAGPPRRRAANHGRPWTEPLDAEFTARWRQGETVAALATRFGRSRSALKSRLVTLELVHPRTHRPLARPRDVVPGPEVASAEPRLPRPGAPA